MKHQILSGLKWTAGAKFGGQIITWVVTIIVMRILSPEDYGLLAMGTVFVMFMLFISEAGLSFALVQKEEIDENLLRNNELNIFFSIENLRHNGKRGGKYAYFNKFGDYGSKKTNIFFTLRHD